MKLLASRIKPKDLESQHTNGKIRVVGKLKPKATKVKCLDCGHSWTTTLDRLKRNCPCPVCAKERVYRFDYHAAKLGKRVVRAQGHELLAAAWLVKECKYSVDTLTLRSEGKTPEVKYKFKGRWRYFTPDLAYNKELFEVKTVWTLTLEHKQLVERAKASADQGYAYKLLVVIQGQVFRLPETWLKKKPVFIDAWLRLKTRTPLRILALDPGTSNFGWSVLYAYSTEDIQVKETGMLRSTVKDLKTDVSSQIRYFEKELDNVMNRWDINAVAVERFMARGMKGVTIELVNIMLGVTLAKLNDGKRKLLVMPASQWKNEFNRHSSLDKLYELAKGCSVHQLDSVGIGVYGAYHWFGQKAFTEFNKNLKSVAKQAVACNREAN